MSESLDDDDDDEDDEDDGESVYIYKYLKDYLYIFLKKKIIGGMIGMGMEFWGMGFSRKTYENSRTTKKRMRVEAQYRACDETLIIYTTSIPPKTSVLAGV